MELRVKYPRTSHLPWSPGATRDDLTLSNVGSFEGQLVVVTEKVDGENTTLYRDGLHARSVTSSAHPSRDRIKALHAEVARDIPSGWRVCGENVYAKHSIGYSTLPGYFMVFSIWNEKNDCLSWEATAEWAELLGFSTVPVLYEGMWNESKIRALYPGKSRCGGEAMEGYVVRRASGFRYADFDGNVAKFVRKDHIQTDEHWMHRAVEPNQLASKA